MLRILSSTFDAISLLHYGEAIRDQGHKAIHEERMKAQGGFKKLAKEVKVRISRGITRADRWVEINSSVKADQT